MRDYLHLTIMVFLALAGVFIFGFGIELIWRGLFHRAWPLGMIGGFFLILSVFWFKVLLQKHL